MRPSRDEIPAFLSIDVEPDGFQLGSSGGGDWTGYAKTFEFIESLRSPLAERSGSSPRVGWYFRTDPQIAEVYGRGDHALSAFPERIRRMEQHGDYLGVHSHPIRWCARRRAWIHDLGDPAWVARCTRSALDTFARWASEPARRFRAGAGFLTNEMVAVAEQSGVLVDLTLEPIAGWGLRATVVPTSIDESPMIGSYTDCREAPRVAFRPAHHDFRVSGGRRGRHLVMVPHTTTPRHPEPWTWRRAARVLLRRRRPVDADDLQILYPSVEWPSPRHFWDLAERRLREMRRPYLSVGIRTDVAELVDAARARQVLGALVDHPLARRLRFADPLLVAPALV